MEIVQKRVIGLFAILIIALIAPHAAAEKSQTETSSIELDHSYDARKFLSTTQVSLFNKLYPDFGETKLEKDWEWKDVDPLALFTPEENRKRRRELFLYEYSPNALFPSESEPNQDQLAFKSVLQSRFPEAVILMTSKTVKLVSRYEPSYDDLPTLRKPDLSIPPRKNILELTADLGLQWSTVGGSTLYIYNGSILMSRFKSGYVSLVDANIDRPKTMTKHNKSLKRDAAKSPRAP
jgi:hypothetical protein